MIILYTIICLLLLAIAIYLHSGYQISPEDEQAIKRILSAPSKEHITGYVGQVTTSTGVTINYNSINQENINNGTILLINGLAQTMLDWPNYMLSAFAESTYHVIRMDNRDVGESTWIKSWGKGNYYRLEDMADDAIAVLDHLNIQKAHVIGVSMGGMIAQTLVLNYPHRFLSLCSMLSTGYFYDKELTQVTGTFRKEITRIVLRYSLIRTKVNAMKAQLSVYHLLKGGGSYYVDRSAVLNRSYYEVVKRNGYNPKASNHHGVAIAKSGSRYDRLGDIAIPTSIIHGTDDPLIFIEHAHKYHQMIPNAQKTIIDGMGHDLPEKYSKSILGAIFKNIQIAS